MKEYVIIDLEMCSVNSEEQKMAFKAGKELIQIGAVLMNEAFQITDTFSTYVAPEYGKLDRYITRLTGITIPDITDAPSAAEALLSFSEWLPKDATIVAWSENDEYQIRCELDGKNISIPRLSDSFGHWIDCQDLFGERMHSQRKYRLSEALLISGLWSDGRAHDALIDATNTAHLFAKLNKSDSVRADNYYYMNEIESASVIFNPFARLCTV